MGLPWVRISQALVLEDSVAVQIFATDGNPGPNTEDEAPAPDRGSDADAGAPAEHTLSRGGAARRRPGDLPGGLPQDGAVPAAASQGSRRVGL